MFDPLWEISCDSGLEQGQGFTYLAKKFGAAKYTICKIRKRKEIISNSVTEYMSDQVKDEH